MKKSVGGTDTVVEVGSGSGISASFIAYEYTATANQTTFSGSDNNSNTLAYNTGTPPSVQVFMNGILLDEGSSQDYTGTNGTSVVLTTAADAGDLIQIHAYKSDVSIVSNLNFNDNQKLQFGDSQDLEIFHDGSQSIIQDVGTGQLKILGENTIHIGSATGSHSYIRALKSGAVELYHNNVKKFETTSTGVDVSGNVTADTGATAQNALDIGGSSATNYTIQRWLTSAHSGNEAYIIAYGAGHVSESGNFAIKNLEASSDIFFELAGSVQPLRLTSTGATFAGTISAGVFTTNANTGTFSNSIGTLPLVTSTPYDYVAKFESTDSGAAIIIEDNNSTSNANRVAVSGNTMKLVTAATTALTINASQNATFAGTISSGAITSSGGIESTSLQTSNIYLSTALYTLNTAGNGWDSTINRNSGSPSANLPGGITSGNITTTGYLRGPSTFTIDPAAHGDDTGTVVIAGNLQIDGTTTTINSTTLTVDDKNITLASGSANAAAANGAGLTVDGASATLTYVSTGDKWSLNKPLDVLFAGDDGVKIESSDNHSSLFIDSHTAYGQYIRFTENNANKYWINSASGKLVFRPAATSTVTNQVIFDASGKVGIGTATPVRPLHVNGGTTDYVARFESSDNNAGIELKDSTSTAAIRTQNGHIVYIADTANAVGASSHRWNIDNLSTGEKMRLNAAGELGIGTTNPSEKLVVNVNSTGIKAGLILNNQHGYGSGVGVASTALQFGRDNTPDDGQTIITGQIYSGNEQETTSNPGFMAFSTKSGASPYTLTERMRIDSTGNVGIGTTNPSSTFQVEGTGDYLANFKSSDAASGIKLTDSSSQSRVVNISGHLVLVADANNNSNNSTIRFNIDTASVAASDSSMILTSTGLGIGTSSPQENLEIHDATMSTISLSYEGNSGNGSSIDFNLRPSSAIASPLTSQIKATDDGAYRQNISFSTKTSAAASSGQTTRMMIKGDGNVGIGDDSPDFKLAIRTPAIPSGSTYAWPLDLSRSNTDSRGLSFGVGASGGPHAIGAHNGDIGIGQTYGTDSNGLPQFYETLSIVHDGTASKGKVGIGTDAPTEKLHIHGGGIYTTPVTYAANQDDWALKTWCFKSCGLGFCRHKTSSKQ